MTLQQTVTVCPACNSKNVEAVDQNSSFCLDCDWDNLPFVSKRTDALISALRHGDPGGAAGGGADANQYRRCQPATSQRPTTSIPCSKPLMIQMTMSAILLPWRLESFGIRVHWQGLSASCITTPLVSCAKALRSAIEWIED